MQYKKFVTTIKHKTYNLHGRSVCIKIIAKKCNELEITSILRI